MDRSEYADKLVEIINNQYTNMWVVTSIWIVIILGIIGLNFYFSYKNLEKTKQKLKEEFKKEFKEEFKKEFQIDKLQSETTKISSELVEMDDKSTQIDIMFKNYINEMDKEKVLSLTRTLLFSTSFTKDNNIYFINALKSTKMALREINNLSEKRLKSIDKNLYSNLLISLKSSIAHAKLLFSNENSLTSSQSESIIKTLSLFEGITEKFLIRLEGLKLYSISDDEFQQSMYKTVNTTKELISNIESQKTPRN
ncbi:hypothetical protein [Leuconostoc fallax]|uniref:hypothetical protein n=1 Tax=Leuconostoc fallax TaxID=1251 RepID=UPI001C1EB954|nr:hypothetical protein [Leuconostoc fallax]MBU7455830.1 hypothetical protein [Leuconostoc fallax]